MRDYKVKFGNRVARIKSGKVTKLTIGVSYGRIWKESNKFK